MKNVNEIEKINIWANGNGYYTLTINDTDCTTGYLDDILEDLNGETLVKLYNDTIAYIESIK